MKLLDLYNATRKAILDHFDYSHGRYAHLPISDSREYYWCLDDCSIQFSETKPSSDEEHVYSSEINHPEEIRVSGDFTMVPADHQIAGDSGELMILDNSKKVEIE